MSWENTKKSNIMRVGIVGAGFTGLMAAFRFLEKGHQVEIFEKNNEPGGLAIGFKIKGWDWTLEEYYHHLFTNNYHLLNLARDLGYQIIIKRPKTSVYTNSKIYQMDSPLNIMHFSELSILQRLRMGVTLGLLRFNPIWQPLERFTAAKTLPLLMGKKPYEVLWEPLLRAKFGDYSDQVSLAWYWGRISERTSSLAYPKGGFLTFAKAFSDKIEGLGGKIHYSANVQSIDSKNDKPFIAVSIGGRIVKKNFDKVIITLPTPQFISLASSLPNSYRQTMQKLKGIGAINMIVRMKKPFLKDNTYWLNVCQKASVLAIVEHTNFMDKKYYNNEHILYLGNYLPSSHPYFKMTPSDLLDTYHPFLKKINSGYRPTIIDFHVFKTPFAQPVIPLRYSKLIPGFKTPLKNIFLANMQQVYPWDRGTSHAVDIGEKVVNIILQK